MKLDDWMHKNLKVKWSESEQRHIGVLQKEPPQDTTNLHVIGTCGDCEHLSESEKVCFKVMIKIEQPFGCIHFEAKG